MNKYLQNESPKKSQSTVLIRRIIVKEFLFTIGTIMLMYVLSVLLSIINSRFRHNKSIKLEIIN